MNGAELIECGLDDVLRARGIGDGIVVGHGTPAGRLDLTDDLIGHRVSGAGTVAGAAEVVDHNTGALFREGQRVLAAQSASCTGDDDDSILYSWHGVSLSARLDAAIVTSAGHGPAVRWAITKVEKASRCWVSGTSTQRSSRRISSLEGVADAVQPCALSHSATSARSGSL